MKLQISDPVLVYAPEMNEAISHWGVYAIPRMWREPTGELVVRFNGEKDSSDFDNLNKAPNLYYISHDEGETWSRSYPIIGKTLDEERAEGRGYGTCKYYEPYSYANTFWERISDDEIILLYNDLRYPDKNGVPTKAAFVRKINITE